MELKLYRNIYTDKSTIGKLHVNGTPFCFTLEDTCRDNNRDGDLKDEGEAKVYGRTCIPSGRFQVIINWSTRFKKMMPLVCNVPGYTGIRIHYGNKPEHTEGCILVGSTLAQNFVGKSVDTFERLMIRMKAVNATGEKIFITIIDQQ